MGFLPCKKDPRGLHRAMTVWIYHVFLVVCALPMVMCCTVGLLSDEISNSFPLQMIQFDCPEQHNMNLVYSLICCIEL
jgi:hypothetical protein